MSNTISYKYCQPEYIKTKSSHNEALKRIQNRYKIETVGIDTMTYRMSRKRVFGSDCFIKRQLPVKRECLERLVKKQKEQLLSLIYEEVEDNLDFKAELTIFMEI